MSQADGESEAGGGDSERPPDGNGTGDGAEPADLSLGPVTSEPRSSLFTRTPLNPEESCLGCVIGAAILLVSVAIWAFVYWLNAPEFHRP